MLARAALRDEVVPRDENTRPESNASLQIGDAVAWTVGSVLIAEFIGIPIDDTDVPAEQVGTLRTFILKTQPSADLAYRECGSLMSKYVVRVKSLSNIRCRIRSRTD